MPRLNNKQKLELIWEGKYDEHRKRSAPLRVALTKDGTHYILETKGLEDVNVVNKDRAAILWCENTTRLTAKPWEYLKVLQTEFTRLQPTSFADLLVLRPHQLV
jgi:hypothetical protein